MPIEWGAINTALLLGVAAYLWRQTQKVDRLYQAIFGVNGRNGMLRRLDLLELEMRTVDERLKDTRHTIRNELQAALFQLHEEFDKRMARQEGKP